MEGSGAPNPAIDRSRAPPYPRTASRSSTSSTRTRMSNNSSSSTQAQRQPYLRTGRTPAPDRPGSRFSREASELSLPTMSTYLQEKLDRERRVTEGERSSSRASNEAAGILGDHKAMHSSPAQNPGSDGKRPNSSGTGAAPAMKEGLGFKQTQQELSKLHKDNWHLKLELYHRREKQAALEERLETLEKEKAETDEMNDQLVQELEKRDKAVEEAVAMIVVLEARVEELIREREMVKSIESDVRYFESDELPRPKTAPKTKSPGFSTLDDRKTLNRVPSFLSDLNETTANLRNVYLEVRGSVISLPRMAEGPNDGERMEHNGVSSPTLSVLSESSFVSVYGQKAAEADSPPPVDGPLRHRGASLGESTASTTPSRPPRSSASRGTHIPAQFQNIHRVLDMSGSPLQRLERLEMALTAMGEVSRPSTSAQEKVSANQAALPQQQLPQPKTKQEKREALQKVLTGHLGREYSNGLPPTPDTISTSTLRRFQNSNDTLSKEQSLVNERSYLALSETTTSQVSVDGDGRGQRTQPASTTAFDGRKTLPLGSSADRRISTSPIPRRRSIDQTTISQRPAREGWESDASDGGSTDDVDSLASSFDPWMRESLKPDHTDALRPANSASQAGLSRQSGRISPDLFSFPAGSKGWAADMMYGSLGGAGYGGAVGNRGPSLSPPMADVMDALGDSLPTPFFASGLASPVVGAVSGPPPPPNRRSSLHAQTGLTSSTQASPARPSPISSNVKRSPIRMNRNRSNSIDLRPPSSNLREVGPCQNRAATVPPKQFHLPPSVPHETQQPTQSQPLPKQRHYPPNASQPPRSRGISNLFRRSTGSAEPSPSPAPSSAPATETTFNNVPLPMMGFPSAGRRSSLFDDDRDSATPPPILRNKAHARLDNDEGGGVPLEPHGGGAPIGVIPSSGTNGGAPTGTAPAPTPQGGGKRKWLGLGRVSSLRHRGV